MSVFGKTTSRRRILGWAMGSLAVFAPVLSPKATFAATHHARRKEALQGAMLAIFKDRDAARAVGKRYLAEHPEDRDAERLMDTLFDRLPVHPSVRRVRETLSSLRVADFSNDRCVLVDNWLLARSEAQACALVALL